jgi:hypothetical protein
MRARILMLLGVAMTISPLAQSPQRNPAVNSFESSGTVAGLPACASYRAWSSGASISCWRLVEISGVICNQVPARR